MARPFCPPALRLSRSPAFGSIWDDENAAIVNALQRHATIVVQKSIEEGFGLTVTEVMWKARPVIASAVGGIREQVSNQRTGVLLADPYDLDGFGDAVTELLGDPDHARDLAAAGRANVRNNFLPDRHFRQSNCLALCKPEPTNRRGGPRASITRSCETRLTGDQRRKQPARARTPLGQKLRTGISRPTVARNQAYAEIHGLIRVGT